MEKALTGLVSWVDARLPITRAWNTHMGQYYAPKNFNLWYFFGVFSLLVLVNQLLTGIWLTMSYTPNAEEAFASVEYIMRDVEYGWLLRYMHSTGASAFFIVVYMHMMRALMYGSYQKPRELIWIFGMLIFVVLMAEAFVGYVLPWGQMSYWGAQVIISLFGAIPVVGEVAEWDGNRAERADGRLKVGLEAVRMEASWSVAVAKRHAVASVAIGVVLGDDCEALAARDIYKRLVSQ